MRMSTTAVHRSASEPAFRAEPQARRFVKPSQFDRKRQGSRTKPLAGETIRETSPNGRDQDPTCAVATLPALLQVSILYQVL
jgi:hypothetical protein